MEEEKRKSDWPLYLLQLISVVIANIDFRQRNMIYCFYMIIFSFSIVHSLGKR